MNRWRKEACVENKVILNRDGRILWEKSFVIGGEIIIAADEGNDIEDVDISTSVARI